jgi:hypothetical protein
MKRLLFQLATITCLLFTYGIAHSQSPFTEDQKKLIDRIKKKMDETEIGLLAESDVTFGEAKSILESVSAEDLEIEKSFMKGSTPKAEKKAVNVKRNRIEAAKLYEKGYNMVFEACESRLKQIKFTDDAKQTKSKDASSQASETMTGAVTKGDDYKYLKDKDLETLRYDDLKSRIEGVNKLFIDGMNLEFESWKIYFSQFAPDPEPVEKKDSVASVDTAKRVDVVAEPIKTESETVTQNITNTNRGVETTLPEQAPKTSGEPIVSNDILTEKPKEAEVKETVEQVKTAVQPATPQPTAKVEKTNNTKVEKTAANTKEPKSAKTKTTAATSTNTTTTKAAPEPKASKKTKESAGSGEALSSSSNLKGTVYLVQLLAIQRGKLNGSAKKELYSGSKKLFEDYENDLYKYRVGEFTSEEEAIKFKQEYGKGCFVLKLIDGKRQMDYINK